MKTKKKSKEKNDNASASKKKKETDIRTRIVIGIFLILLGIYILLSFIDAFLDYDITGKLGGKIGLFLSSRMFGIGSIYFIIIIIGIGINLIFRRPKLYILRICKNALMSFVWIPLLFALIMQSSSENGTELEKYYGITSKVVYDFLDFYISKIGILILLLLTGLTYIIYSFNITFEFLRKKSKNNENENDNKDNEDTDNDNKQNKPDENEWLIKPIDKENKDYEDDNDTNFSWEIKKDNKDDNDPTFEITTHPEESSSDDDSPNESDSDISMEVTEIKEEKQVKENGEHFGLDTAYDPRFELSNYVFPTLDLLKDYGDNTATIDTAELENNKNKIVETLSNYSIAISKIKATVGPTVTLYEIVPAAGVRISKIKNLQDDIALCLSALGIRIIAPIPGKGTVGIEVPNNKSQIVSMRSIISSERFQKCNYELPFGIGKTISNESYVADLAKMPHILMAGATGQGKSVGINAIIASLLYSKHPAELKFVLVDPKKVELSLYKKIERHFLAKLPDSEESIITDVRKVVRTLNSLCIEMDNRYELLKDAQVRNIKEYNAKFISRRLNPLEGHRFMPYIVLVVDEFADLIMTAGKEIEAPITRLAQLARAIGIHLIIATQRPSVNIITGTIKANFPARMAFRVMSRVDSSTILDSTGAEQLIGRGDMLLSTGNDLVRLQCPFIDTPEVEAITEFIGSQRAYPEAYTLPDCPDEQDDTVDKENINPNERDPLFEDAARLIVQSQQGSTSMLQRKFKIGYNRAGRIIDQLECAGIVGPFAGSKQREVKIQTEYALDQLLNDLNYKE